MLPIGIAYCWVAVVDKGGVLEWCFHLKHNNQLLNTATIFNSIGVTQFKLGQSTKSTSGVNNRRFALDFAKKSPLKTGPV